MTDFNNPDHMTAAEDIADQVRLGMITLDPRCDECGWEESHVRHHSPVLYNYHPFVRGPE